MNEFASISAPHRVRRCVRVILEGLQLIEREPDESYWLAAALHMAVYAALIAALSGYDTAKTEDVVDRHASMKSVSIGGLMTRVGMKSYLNPPERLTLTDAQKQLMFSLARKRNSLLHAAGPLRVATPEEIETALMIVKHTIRDAPSFQESLDPLSITLIKEAVARLQVRFGILA